MSSKKTYKTSSSEETKALGLMLARKFSKQKAKSALVFALQGDLGAGKTTFTQGFMKGLGSKRRATSPTFIIMRRHSLKNIQFKNIFHIDAYRLKTAEHLAVLGFNDIVQDPRNIIMVEWADRVRKLLPKKAIHLDFKHGRKENERRIIITQ